jgi:hypothetical protein
VAEHGERVVSPPDPAVLYRRAWRRVARLTAVGILLAGVLLAGVWSPGPACPATTATRR